MKLAVPSSKLDFFVHPTSIVDDQCVIGAGTKIWHFCHIMSGSRIGQNCSFGQNCSVGTGVVIGNNVKVQNNVSIYEGVILEDDVFCGPSMVFTNVINPRSHVPRKDQYKETLIKRGASIGANATIVCGATVGRYAFLGAGTVITRNIPDYALVYGNPARIKGWMCQCGIKLSINSSETEQQVTCKSCSSRYIKRGNILIPDKE